MLAKGVTHLVWDDLEPEEMVGSITRRFISTEQLMLGEIRFAKGDSVPAHRHVNEQITYVLNGALEFLFGEEQDRQITVRAGEVVVIPSNVLHSAEALEDTFELDIFNPPRADWLDGSDGYMRK